MNELLEFEEFFRRMGVVYSVAQASFPERPEVSTMLSVTQNHFLFDASGVYLGSMPDEMGCFKPRKR